jgi:hypothetical protein
MNAYSSHVLLPVGAQKPGSGVLRMATNHVAVRSSAAIASAPSAHGASVASGRARQRRSVARVCSQPRTNASSSVAITYRGSAAGRPDCSA